MSTATIGAQRDHAVDAVRVWAMTGVVLGHWLVTGFVAGADGLRVASPLSHMPWFAPLSWVLQTLGLFFFAGGFAAAKTNRPLPGRVVWLPLALVAGWALVLTAGAAAGVAGGTLRTVAVLVASPLWFLLPYFVLRAARDPLRRLVARFGPGVALPPVVVVAVTDHPGSVIAAWAVPWLLGTAVALGRFGTRRQAVVLAAAGIGALLLLVTVGGHPVSAVGVPGAGRSNLSPPSLVAVALAAAQIGVFLLLRPRLGRAGRWVSTLNRSALPIFLGHQSVLLAVVLAASALGSEIPGLIDAPDGPGWILARLTWIPLLAATLAALVIPRKTRPRTHPKSHPETRSESRPETQSR